MPPGGPLGVGGLDGLAVQKILDPDEPLDLGVVAAVGERHSSRHVSESQDGLARLDVSTTSHDEPICAASAVGISSWSAWRPARVLSCCCRAKCHVASGALSKSQGGAVSGGSVCAPKWLCVPRIPSMALTSRVALPAVRP